MKKNNLLLSVLLVVIAICVLVYFVWLNTKTINDSSVDLVKDAPDQVQIAEQSFCDKLGPQKGSAALSSHFTLGLRNLEPVPTDTTLQGCIKSIDGSYGNWKSTDGIIGTYEVFLENRNFITQGAIAVIEGKNIQEFIKAGGHIPFQTNIRLNPETLTTETGYIVFSNYNPTGEPTKDEKISYQITFKK